MQLISIVDGAAWSVHPTQALRVQQNPDGTFDYEGDGVGARYANAADLMVLPDDVDVEIGSEIDPVWRAVEIPLTRLLAPSPEGALADALGLVMRSAVADGSISNDELLRIAPALEERMWRAGLDVVAGDVFADDGDLWVCIQAHTTQGSWRPVLTPTLWRKVEPKTDGPRIWTTSVDYAVGDAVKYPDTQGDLFTCITPHMSQAGWEPPNVPALWEKNHVEEMIC